MLVAFRGMSPMVERQALTGDSYQIYREKADAILGEDQDYVYQEGEEIPPEVLEKITRVYTEVYDQPGIYGVTLLSDLIDEFGLEAVMEQYHYATDPQTLYNTRVKKLTAMEMVWQDQDLLTKLLGVEYAQCRVGSHIYDPENDFPALLYYYGYVGIALYAAFGAYFLLASLRGLVGDWRRVLCVEFGVPGHDVRADVGRGAVFRTGAAQTQRHGVWVLGGGAAVWVSPSSKGNGMGAGPCRRICGAPGKEMVEMGQQNMRETFQTVKQAIVKKLPWVVGFLIVIQPLLDVLSYFLGELGNNSLSTALRFLMLMVVALLGFVVSERKRIYVIFYGVVALFWAAHMLNCFRIGYQSFVSDTANFLRILNFPVFALSFITLFRQGKDLGKFVCAAFAINLGEIIVFTALPWLTGNPVYTYDTLFLGVMGWFGVANAQSAIIVLVTPLAILFSWKSGKYPLFLASLVLGFGLMFVTGTKFTFYSIFIVAGAFVFLFVLNFRKQALRYVIPLLAVVVLVAVFRQYAPMVQRESQSAYAISNYQDRVEESLKNTGTDQEELEQLKAELEQEEKQESGSGHQAPTIGAEIRLQRLRESLMGVYTDPEVYGPVFENLYQRFGVYNVMEIYNYTSDPTILSDSRIRKTMYAQMMWQEKDFLTHLLGFEYSDMVYDGTIYDLENDFPAVFYFCGYVGFALYMLFLAVFAVMIFQAFGQDVAAAWKARGPLRGEAWHRSVG